MKSKMKLAVLLTSLLAALSAQPLQGQVPPPPKGKKATLRIAWWNMPAEPPQLALLQDKTHVDFIPGVMSLGQKTAYQGPDTVVIAKKSFGAVKDKTGKLPVMFTPFATLPLPADGADLGVLMFPDKAGQSASLQLFDFSEESFPYGSIQIVNFTNSTIDAIVGAKTLKAMPRQTVRYPGRFDKRQPAKFQISATASGEEPYVVCSSTLIFYPDSRLIYFLLESPGATRERRYRDTLIKDHKVVAPPPPPLETLVPKEKPKEVPTPKVKAAA
jgi:hypothetical protein